MILYSAPSASAGPFRNQEQPAQSDIRRRVQLLKLIEVGASTIPTTTPGTLSSVVDLSAYNEMLIYVFGLSIAGSATGLVVAMQKVEPQNGTWFDHPNGIINVTTATGSSLLAGLALTNFGALCRFRITCSANSFSGGFVQVFVEAKR